MGVLKGKQWLPRDVALLCYKHGWTEPRNLALMVATVGGESDYFDEAEGDPHEDGTIDLGLFQLNSIHAENWNMTAEQFKEMAFNPAQAVIYARKLWNDARANSGDPFKPWYAYSNGGYKRHLKGAVVGVANMLFVMEGLEPRARWI